MNVKPHDEYTMTTFMKERLNEGVTIYFFQPLKKLGLKRFLNLQKVVDVDMKDRMVPLKINRDLFGQMVIIMQNRNVDLKEIFKYPLEPLPWSLSGVVGELHKTNKVAILHHLEKDTTPLSHPSHNHAAIIDGMAAIQKAKANGSTFQQVADKLLQFIISGSRLAHCIDIVFDVYRDSSIKNAERVRRSTGKLEFPVLYQHKRFKSRIRSCPVAQTKLHRWLS